REPTGRAGLRDHVGRERTQPRADGAAGNALSRRHGFRASERAAGTAPRATCHLLAGRGMTTPAKRFPWATILPFGGKVPRIHETAFVAPGARIIGDVTIGPEASVWYNCVLRGDIHRIEVGARSNVQDGSV